jgi:hypothetical protein
VLTGRYGYGEMGGGGACVCMRQSISFGFGIVSPMKKKLPTKTNFLYERLQLLKLELETRANSS